MKIIVDGFGGDNAPVEVLNGCVQAIAEYGVQIIVTGDVEKIKQAAQHNNIDISKIELVDAKSVIPVEEDPTKIMSDYSDSSMAAAFKLLADGTGDAMVCAGSTGAMVVGSSLIVKRIKGVKRATLAPIMPCANGCYILVDAGANIECRPEMLEQFAIMGSIYMEKIIGKKSPSVGLVNVGTEETKGTELQVNTFELLKNNKVINFAGNIEAREVPLGGADVVVADGFTGNVILKLTEGLGKMLVSNLKGIFSSGILSKLAAVMVMKNLKAFKNQMDYTEYGGSPLLGISKPVIKAHGSSNAKAFKNAIRQARDFIEKDVNNEIITSLEKLKQQD